MAHIEQEHRKAVIGNPSHNFWLYDSKDGFDLTHPSSVTSPTVDSAIKIRTRTQPITIDPAKSALVIVDMQNMFLSPALGRSPQSKGLGAQAQLLRYAIPAARKAHMRIVWLNWGLVDNDVRTMPPAVVRCFGFETFNATSFDSYIGKIGNGTSGHALGSNEGVTRANDPPERLNAQRKNARIYIGLGNDLGQVELRDGKTVEAGRLLMRDQWNTQLTPELSEAYEEGLKCDPPDVWVHKRRMSGIWGPSNACRELLDEEGIKTLFFAGVNTDQCVGGSMTDAFSEGYDCILLSDGAATSSPAACQEGYEFNAAGTFGFCTSCKDLWDAVET